MNFKLIPFRGRSTLGEAGLSWSSQGHVYTTQWLFLTAKSTGIVPKISGTIIEDSPINKQEDQVQQDQLFEYKEQDFESTHQEHS